MEQTRPSIAFISDVACPWCATGLAWLDGAHSAGFVSRVAQALRS